MQHAFLEGLVGLESPITLAHYQSVLRRFALFMPAWEDEIATILPPHLRGWFQPRRRAHLLAQDLNVLGCSGMPDASWPVPRYRSRDEALGAIYVMEGSTLGGAVITRRLQADLALTPVGGAAYFHGHGPNAGAMWKAFKALLDDELSSTIDRAAAVEGATRTFECLIALFSTPLPADAS